MTRPCTQLPKRASGWLEGQTLAYLIDFLGADGKTVEFRIHYQDAASERMLGYPPPLDMLDDKRPVDLALVCMPGFNEVDNYPEAFIGRIPAALRRADPLGELLRGAAGSNPADLRTVAHEPAKRFLARLEKVLKAASTSCRRPASGCNMFHEVTLRALPSRRFARMSPGEGEFAGRCRGSPA